MLSDIIRVDLVEHSTSVIDDFCVVSRVPVTVPVRLLGGTRDTTQKSSITEVECSTKSTLMMSDNTV